MAQGIDIASYQVSNYATAGLSFVFIKATESTNYVNPKHSAQVLTGRAHGLVIGHYHFVRPGSMTAQVQYFLDHALPRAGDVLALDWEDAAVSSADKDAFLKYLQSKTPRNKVVLYCNRDFWLNRDKSSYAADGLWIADPSAPMGHPRITHDWRFHQYSEAGGLDHDYTAMSADALRAWAGNQAVPQEAPAATTTPGTALHEEDDMSVALDVLTYRNKAADDASVKTTGKHIPDVYGYLVGTYTEVKGLHAAINTLAGLVGKDVDTAQVVAAVNEAIATAIANATVHVSVDVNDATAQS